MNQGTYMLNSHYFSRTLHKIMQLYAVVFFVHGPILNNLLQLVS